MLSRARTGPRFGIYQIRDGKIVAIVTFHAPDSAGVTRFLERATTGR